MDAGGGANGFQTAGSVFSGDGFQPWTTDEATAAGFFDGEEDPYNMSYGNEGGPDDVTGGADLNARPSGYAALAAQVGGGG